MKTFFQFLFSLTVLFWFISGFGWLLDASVPFVADLALPVFLKFIVFTPMYVGISLVFIAIAKKNLNYIFNIKLKP